MVEIGSRQRGIYGARMRSEEHTSELQSHRDLHPFPPRRSSDLGLDQIDCAPPKATACHPRSVDSTLPRADFNHDVQFSAADFVVVPKTAAENWTSWLKSAHGNVESTERG